MLKVESIKNSTFNIQHSTFFYLRYMISKTALSRTASIWISLLIYLLATLSAIFAGRHFYHFHPLIMIAAGDMTATMVVFVFSLALNNSSVYDPYWSIKPLVIAFAYLFILTQESLSIRQWLVISGVVLYSFRLTSNFYRDWPGFSHEDWRYVNFRKKFGKTYWLISFLAIHFFPTIMVYLGCMALLPVFAGGDPLNGWDIFAAIVLFGSIFYAFIADEQLRGFRNKPVNKGKIIKTGLWHFSRHPNYLGEISTWWGLALFAIAAGLENWWTLAGPVAITLMFLFASIPLIEERHLERRQGYMDYISETPVLLPLKFWK
jgi:steroid 5-alpha reductase family enzyme